MQRTNEVYVTNDLVSSAQYSKQVDRCLFDLLVYVGEAGLAMELGFIYDGQVLVGLPEFDASLPKRQGASVLGYQL